MKRCSLVRYEVREIDVADEAAGIEIGKLCENLDVSIARVENLEKLKSWSVRKVIFAVTRST